MAKINLPYRAVNNDVITADNHNLNFDAIYNEFNGNIDDENIKATAAIAWSKLAPIVNRNLMFGSGFGISGSVALDGQVWLQQNIALPQPMSPGPPNPNRVGKTILSYNTYLSGGAWTARVNADVCTAMITTQDGSLEWWVAASDAAGVTPNWVKAVGFDYSGNVNASGAGLFTGQLIVSQYLTATRGIKPNVIVNNITANISGSINSYFSYRVAQVPHNYGYIVMPTCWINYSNPSNPNVLNTVLSIYIANNTMNSFDVLVGCEFNSAGTIQVNFGYAY